MYQQLKRTDIGVKFIIHISVPYAKWIYASLYYQYLFKNDAELDN